MNLNQPTNIINRKIDQWQLFTDLIGLVAIFSGILYFGGFVYIKSYFDKFFMNPAIINSNIAFFITAFIDEVVFKNVITLLIAMFIILIFVALFYLARNIFPSWSGFISLCFSFLILFFLSTVFAKRIGEQNAERDWFSERSHLPRVTLLLEEKSFETEFVEMAARSELRLIYEGREFVYLFKPRRRNDQSDLPVYVIPKVSITQLNIFNVHNE